MTTTNRWVEYQNGNYSVALSLEDGSKIRTFDGEPIPRFPESIDLKITDYCDAGCAYCHEKSTRRGVHASLDAIFQVIDGLPVGTEVAIGGGNPLSHPYLAQILERMTNKGLVPNLTVNEKHFVDYSFALRNYQRDGRLFGVGISVAKPTREMLAYSTMLENVVWHVIVGIGDFAEILRKAPDLKRILVLGYKDFGFGVKHNPVRLKYQIAYWRFHLAKLLRSGAIVSFDNRGLKQLQVEEMLNQTDWNDRFMGYDGQFTMYADAVFHEYAISSTSPRQPFGEQNIEQMFADVRKRSSEVLLNVVS